MANNIPIQSLVFFEATARHKSFTKAANELCVTQSAVSKQIKNLESYFDQNLFERKYHELELTFEGEKLFETVKPLIIELQQSVLQFKNNKSSKSVNIICTLAVAHYFLFPKVILFNKVYPDININIISTNNISEKDCIENDFGILYGEGDFHRLSAVKLFDEEIYPITAFQYKLPIINSPEDLLDLQLLQLDPKKWNWMNWSNWFKHFDIDYKLPNDSPIYNQVTLAVNASMHGFGVTLGWNFMVRDMIENKILKKVGDHSFKTGFADYLVHSKSKPLSYSAEVFKRWLLEN